MVSGVLQPIFLSYARDDAAAARCIAEALRSAGLVVWFDENELTGGDAWDQKIRTQIAECALFVPLISANTQARLEGYFRLEWRLAEQRSHLMAKGKRFLVPVCIDDTREKGAQVPDAFMDVQWTRLAGGVAMAQFVELVKRLMEGAGVAQTAAVARAFQPAGSENTGGQAHGTKSENMGRQAHGTKTGVPAAAWIGAVAVVAIGVAAIFFAMRKTESPTPGATNAGAGTRPPTSEIVAAPKAVEKSVAVLAFENVGGDKENEIFSDGVPDEILTQLGKAAGLRLAGRNSSFALRGRPDAEVAQVLNVSHVVSGSVQRVGSQVKITARLVNAADGTQLWQDRFTEEMKDIFAVQEKIAGLIAQNLSLKLSGGSRVAKSVDPEAQRLVLEGRFHWNLRNEEGFTRAEAAFTRAIALAPDMAVAHAGIAGVWAIRVNFRQLDGITDGREDIGRARSAAERAVELDQDLAEAHAVLAFCLLLEGKLVESERSFQRALALNPNSTVAVSWHALLLRMTGRIDLAIADYQRVATMDPLWFINLLLLGVSLSDAERWEEALGAIDRAMALRSDLYIPAVGVRARALFALGRKAEALDMARLVRQRPDAFPRWNSDSHAIFVLRQAGLEQEAAEHAAEVFARAPADSYVRGFVLGVLGQFERALPYLERTPSIGRLFVYYDQMWSPWRDDARFLQVVSKIGVAEDYKTARETVARMQRGQAGKK